jgi:glutathione S-transferase
MTATLHAFAESGNAYKCALAMRLAGMAFEVAFVPFFQGGARTPEFRALNVMGEVPVLVHDGRVLSQSAVILRHVARRTGKLAGSDEDEVLRWLFWDNHKLSTQIGTTRFLMNFLAPDKRPEAVIPFQQGRLKAAYAVLNDHLSARDWVEGTAPSIADLSLCGYLYYPEPFGFARTDWPAIDAWLGRIAALPGWAHPYDLLPRAFPAQGEPT